jgi:hypothetical protein
MRMAKSNTLAYYVTAPITVVESFLVQTPGFLAFSVLGHFNANSNLH